jgi:hypothetical protein
LKQLSEAKKKYQKIMEKWGEKKMECNDSVGAM